MQLGNNWERKVPHKHMVIRTFKNSIQKKKKEFYTKSGFVREIRKSEQPRQFSMIPHP